VITWATGGNQRLAIMSTAVLFIAGLLLLLPVNVRRGRNAAVEADNAAAAGELVRSTNKVRVSPDPASI
jgi:hypothetical protein